MATQPPSAWMAPVRASDSTAARLAPSSATSVMGHGRDARASVVSRRRASGASAVSTASRSGGLRRAVSHQASSEVSESNGTSVSAVSVSAVHQR